MTEATIAELFNRWIRDGLRLSISCSHQDFFFSGLAILDSATDDKLEFSRGLGLAIELQGASVEIVPPTEMQRAALSRVDISLDSGVQFVICEIDLTPSSVPIIG